MSNATPSLDVDHTTKQTVDNLTCFVICISICAVALLAQLFNIFMVFRRSAGKSRRIFFYLLLPSAIFCGLIYVTLCAQLVLGYLTSHSYAWIKALSNQNGARLEHQMFWERYVALEYTLNILYSLFTVLYILCVQLRFQAIHAIFLYPKWIDYVLIILTLSVWFSIDLLCGVLFYPSNPSLGYTMVAIWTVYVLFTDNVLSAIFLWKLWKSQNDIRTFSSRRGKISRNIIRGMIGMCVTLWISLFMFGLNPTVFNEDKYQNMTKILVCAAMAVFPIYFSLGFAWMEAVLQLYSGPSNPKSTTILKDSKNLTLSMKVKASSPRTTYPNVDGWASVINEERDCPYDGSGAVIDMQHTSNIAQAAK